MAVHNVVFPGEFQRGYVSGPGWKTIIQETASGHEQRIISRAQSRKTLRPDVRWLANADLGKLLNFYQCRRGAAYGFLVLDIQDFTTAVDHMSAATSTDVTIGAGDGTTTIFQLSALYDDDGGGPLPYSKKISYPVPATTLVALDAVNKSAGSDFTVNTTSGEVTFSAAPTPGQVVTAGCQFYTPARFSLTLDSLMGATNVSFNVGDLRALEMIELLDEDEWSDVAFFGGAVDHGQLAADLSITPAEAKIHRMDPNGNAINCYLPAPGSYPSGELLAIITYGSSGTVQVLDHEANAVGSAIAVGAHKYLTLFNDGSSGFWILS